MYSCARALVRRNGDNQRLIETQVNLAPVRELMSDYALVYLILTHKDVDHELSLNLKDAEDIVYSLSPNTSVDEWLLANNDKTLPTSDTLPKATAGVAKFRDIFVAGYHVELAHPFAGEGTQLPDIELTDLKVTRPDTDYKEVFEHGLFTVNGLYHIADYSTEGIVIKGGGKSVQYANRNNIGITSLLSVGKTSFYPITDDMILSTGPAAIGMQPLRNGVILSLPDVDLKGKIVMLSLGGILHFSNDRYSVRGEHSIMLEWWKLPLMEMFYDIKPYIDMSSFEATLSPVKKGGETLDLDRANKDESIRAFLKLQQSFIILIDADNFFCERIAVEKTGLAGRYVTHERPKYPLQLENGFMPEYMTYSDWGEYVISIDKNLINRYIHSTRPYDKEDNYVSGAKISSFPTFYGSAYLLEMGTEFIT